jgi:glycosyltransferase involved in cell wall biosynthesis
MDVYLNTSLSEGLSIAIIEAMASGLPVIATDVGGNPEVVENGVNGFLVPSRNPQALAERIKYLYQYPEMLNMLAKNSRERAEKLFSGLCMKRSYLELIEKIQERD